MFKESSRRRASSETSMFDGEYIIFDCRCHKRCVMRKGQFTKEPRKTILQPPSAKGSRKWVGFVHKCWDGGNDFFSRYWFILQDDEDNCNFSYELMKLKNYDILKRRVLLTSVIETLFKHTKLENYSLNKLNKFNFHCIKYTNFYKKFSFKDLKECLRDTR